MNHNFAGQLHHINIKVSDLGQSITFWGWFLGKIGWEKFDSWPKGVSYRLGSTYLDFVQVEKNREARVIMLLNPYFLLEH